MNKVVPGVLLTSIFLGLAAVSFQQYQLAEGKKQTVENQTKEINYLEENLDLQIQENSSLEEENYFLEEQLKGSRDSLTKANSALVNLRQHIKNQAVSMKATKQKLAQLKRRYSELQSQKGEVGKGDQAQYIEKLKAEKRSLLQEMLELRKSLVNKNATNNSGETTRLIHSMEAEVTPTSNEYNVDLLQTRVVLNSFALRKRKLGKPLRKIGKNDDWKYTTLNISLEHPISDLLLNTYFKAKIINSQTGNVLSFVESNPNFPNSILDSKGVGFEYQGKNLELTYYNADFKKGKDYHLAFYIVDKNGNEHTLPGATFHLVKKGKVVK